MPCTQTTHLLDLQPHPALPAPPGITVVAGAEPLSGGGLRLGFVLHGAAEVLDRIVIPESSSPIRVDGLWQRTCCEAFVGVPGETTYREFNFSPSGAWAAYAFADYRKPMPLPLGPVPPIAFLSAAGTLTLATTLAPGWLPKVPHLCVGLSVVIETIDGERSYWALAHPAAQPDFHHCDGFVLPLEIAHEIRT
jgi:hypothetical protein